MKSCNKFKQNWQLILIIHYVIHQEWTHKYQNINTFQMSAIYFETFIFVNKTWFFFPAKKNIWSDFQLGWAKKQL